MGAAQISKDAGLRQATLRRLFNEHRWPFEARGIQPEDTLVTCAETAEVLAGVGLPGLPKVLTEEQVVGAELAGRVFVLLPKGERAFVRQLKREQPKASVFSATYGEEGGMLQLADLLEAGGEYVGLFHTEQAGFRYLAASMAANGLGEPVEAWSVAEELWAGIAEDYSPLRAAAAKLAGHRGVTVLRMRLETLDEFCDQGRMNYGDLKRIMDRLDAPAVYLSRRHKIEQALLCLDGKEGGGQNSYDALRPILFRLLGIEARAEQMLSALRSTRMVTVEELLDSPVEVVKALAPFMGMGSPRKVTVVDPRDEFKQKKRLEPRAREVAAAISVSLGIEKNAKGSFVSISERLLEKNSRSS